MSKIIYLTLLQSFLFWNLPAQDFRILYFNDAHDLEPLNFNNQEVGGIAKVAQLIKDRKNDKTFVLFGGDLAGGTLTGKVFKGSVMVKAMNEIGIDAANTGQHEFDYGIENFLSLKKFSNFPWINSNLVSDDGDGDDALTLPYIILKKNNIEIGVVGLTDKIETSSPGLPIKSLDFAKVLKNIFNQNPGVKFWVALTQMDLDLNEKLHKNFPQINLILTEETYHDRTQIIWHEYTPIIAISGNAGDIAEINYRVTKSKIIPNIYIHPIRKNSPQDIGMQQWVNDSIQSMNKKLNLQLGYAKSDFLKQETKNGERAIGNLVTDAFRDAYKSEIAIIQGGGIRSGINEGVITLKDIFAVLPYENDLVLARLTGQEIKNILDQSIQRLVPQVSGLKLKIGIKNTKKFIEELNYKNNLIELNKEYLVSLPSYIVDGGGNFEKLESSKILKRNIKDAEALKNYILKKKNIQPILENRIF